MSAINQKKGLLYYAALLSFGRDPTKKGALSP